MHWPNSNPRVAVVGGGLAGLAAAVRCLRHHVTPVLFEKRPYLGGRAFSFADRETGVEVDNGQHVFVGACAEYRAFLDEIGAGADVTVQPRLQVPVIREGQTSTLGWSRFDRLKLLPSLLGYSHLSAAAKWRVVRGILALRRVDLKRRWEDLDRITFRSWLVQHGQRDEEINRVWNLIILPGLNDPVDDASAAYGIMLFQVGLLRGRAEAVIGYSRVGLSQLAGSHASRYLATQGGVVHTSADVGQVRFDDDGAAVLTLGDGSESVFNAVVLAVPHFALRELLSNETLDKAGLRAATTLETSPIVGVHLWYDRPVMSESFVAVLDSPLQFVFNVTAIHPGEPVDPPGGQHVVISLSGAREWVGLDRAALQARFVPEMARAFPEARGAQVVRFLSVKQVNATFRVAPGAEALRPEQTTSLPGLFVAGDWTRTGWPSTMESAVRSGNRAANAAAHYLARQRAVRESQTTVNA